MIMGDTFEIKDIKVIITCFQACLHIIHSLCL